MATANEQPQQEYDDNLPTGVEVEEEDAGSFEDIQQPWDPESIRVATKSFSLRNILDLIDERALDLAPDFQRLQVWKSRQKSQLIESLLLQIPLPAFYFSEDSDGGMRVIDGLQRLSTVHEFVRGTGFQLRELEYVTDVQGFRFADLPPLWKRRINNTQIVVHVIAPSTPAPVQYDIFRRINTGGTPLNAQEIRHCMSKARSRAFLKRCVDEPMFVSATGRTPVQQKRMIDREVVLRFSAFKLLPSIEDYRQHGSMESLLLATTQKLDDPREVQDLGLDQLHDELLIGLGNARFVFGEHAFRKWTTYSDALNPFNRALFESWTYALSNCDQATLKRYSAAIVGSARDRMTNDLAYVDSVTLGTGDPRRVEYRFNVAQEILSVADGA